MPISSFIHLSVGILFPCVASVAKADACPFCGRIPTDQEHEKDTPVNILVVDDDAEFNTVLREALTISGHNVQSAADGDEAFQILQHSPVDLVISDIQMPACSGTRLHSMIRHDERLHMIPFIFITGHTLLRMALPVGGQGLDFVVGKIPFDKVLRAVHDIHAN